MSSREAKREPHTYSRWLDPGTPVFDSDPERFPDCGTGRIPPNVRVLVETIMPGWPKGIYANVIVRKVGNTLAVEVGSDMGPQSFSIGGLTIYINKQCYIPTSSMRRLH